MLGRWTFKGSVRARLAIDDAPVLSLTKVDGHLLEEVKVVGMGTGGKLAQSGDGVANIRTTGDIGKQQFPK